MVQNANMKGALDNIPSHGEKTKMRIIDEAVKLFCKKGYENTSVREIVLAAKVTKPALYYYFKNKEDLFYRIIQNSLDPFYQDIREICHKKHPDFPDRLSEIVEHYLESARIHPDHVRFLHAIAFSGLYNDIYDFADYWMKHIDLYKILFLEGVKKGILRKKLPPYVMARSFMGLCQMAMRSIVYCPDKREPPPSAREIVDIFLRGIQR